MIKIFLTLTIVIFLAGCGTGGSDIPFRSGHIPNMCVDEFRDTVIDAVIELRTVTGSLAGSMQLHQEIEGRYITAEGNGCAS